MEFMAPLLIILWACLSVDCFTATLNGRVSTHSFSSASSQCMHWYLKENAVSAALLPSLLQWWLKPTCAGLSHLDCELWMVILFIEGRKKLCLMFYFSFFKKQNFSKSVQCYLNSFCGFCARIFLQEKSPFCIARFVSCKAGYSVKWWRFFSNFIVLWYWRYTFQMVEVISGEIFNSYPLKVKFLKHRHENWRRQEFA